jgi:conjugal transfer ATP-binding protein TraC
MGNLIGDFYQNQLAYACPFVITMGAHILNQSDNKSTATIRGARATTNATSPMARFMPEYADKKHDWDIVNKSYAAGMGEVDLYHQVLLMARPDAIEAVENTATSIWRARGFSLVPQQFMQVPGILTSMPLGFTPTMHKFYKRTGLTSRKTTMNAVNMSPVLGEWKGTSTPVIQLMGRRGQLMALDLFDNKGGNYNFAVAASSGSGKSVLANELSTGYLGIGAKVFIIDVGRSYEKLCRLLDGEFIEFVNNPDWQICINPFDNIDDLSEDMEILKPLVAQMISPSGTLTDYDMPVIEKAITTAWMKKNRSMTITDVAQAMLDSEDPTAHRLGAQLYPYTRDGMYGKYFEGKSNVDFTKDFVVLELEELKSKKDLQSVVLFIMMFRITQCMYKERDRKKVCIIDEAWDLMRGGNSGIFIEEGYRRARKYGGSFGTLTQSIEDYYKNPAAQAALDNSDWLFLLKQKKESIEQLERGGKLKLDESGKRILSSVKTEQGHYSEIFINSPMGSGVGRLIVDPFTLLVYSSAPEDWSAISHYRKEGLSVTEAINAVLNDRAQRAGGKHVH